jgi:hypothetical protein
VSDLQRASVGRAVACLRPQGGGMYLSLVAGTTRRELPPLDSNATLLRRGSGPADALRPRRCTK